jgi:alanine-glyoxylate transaminase / serine-glyoxylate transaminase / serine-pyruvate transaminase
MAEAATERKTNAAPHRFLFAPGPTNVDPRVYGAMIQPVVGIRDPFFFQCMADVQSGLRAVFGTKNEQTFVLTGTGSSGMEAAIANFVKPGMKVAVFANGFFADRQAETARRHGAEIIRFDKEWGEVFSADEAEKLLREHRPEVVSFVHAETSTGAVQPPQAITKPAREIGAFVVADCVTSLGAMPVELDGNGIDIAYSCSQKGLSCPAGLSPVTVSPRAWQWLESRPALDTWALDLKMIDAWFGPGHVYHHTPSATLYYALREGLAVIEEEGLKNRWERHHRVHHRLLAGLTKLGFQPVVQQPENRIWHLLNVYPPKGVNEAQLRAHLFERYNIDVAGGIGKLAGKILRIGIMGPLAIEERADALLEAISASI